MRLNPVFILAVSGFSCVASAAEPLDDFLRDGRFTDGVAALAAPATDAECFSLAALQCLDGLQHFVTSINTLGINSEVARSLPFFRMAMRQPAGPRDGGTATPATVAALFRDFRKSLQAANQTLQGMTGEDFGVTVNFSTARMDFDGDGVAGTNELLLTTLDRNRMLRAPDATGTDLVIRFDAADAAWLKGYTHLLSGLLDVFMTYDWTPVWNQCAHRLFLNPQPEPPIAAQLDYGRQREVSAWVDLLAALHDMRLEPVNPERLEAARRNFMAAITCSRDYWRLALLETDNDHEWLPSPTQTGPRGSEVSATQVEVWQKVLSELEDVLMGRKLLAHWRIKDGTGINIDKLVKSPPRFDLVLIIQGSVLLPFLEEGVVTDRNAWRTMLQPFGPGFGRFAFWCN